MTSPGQQNPEEEPQNSVDSSQSAGPEHPPNAPGHSKWQRVLRLVTERTVAAFGRLWLWLVAVAGRLGRWAEPRLRRVAPYAERLQRSTAPVIDRARRKLAPTIQRVEQRMAPFIERVQRRVAPFVAKLREKLPESARGRHRVPARSRSVQLTAVAAAFGVLAIIVGSVTQGTQEQTTPAAQTVQLQQEQRTKIEQKQQEEKQQTAQQQDKQDQGQSQDKQGEAGSAGPSVMKAPVEEAEPKDAPEANGAPAKPAPDIPANASGIDVSNHNGPINWKKVADSGQQYAFVLATDGGSFTNPMFEGQFKGAKGAGMLAGAYHFGRPSGSAVGQANRLMDTMGSTSDGRTLPPVLDLETSPSTGGCYGKTTSQMHDWVQTFLDQVEKRSDQQGIIYANQSFWSNCMGGTQAFSEYPLWIASYGVSQPSMLGGWNKYSFWQHTDSGNVPGVSGPVDMNKFKGAGEELLSLTEQ